MSDSNLNGTSEVIDPREIERLGLVWNNREAWINLIRESLSSDEPAVATIIFEMMDSPVEPDDFYVRSMRELALYYVHPVHMPAKTRFGFSVDVRIVESAVKGQR